MFVSFIIFLCLVTLVTSNDFYQINYKKDKCLTGAVTFGNTVKLIEDDIVKNVDNCLKQCQYPLCDGIEFRKDVSCILSTKVVLTDNRKLKKIHEKFKIKIFRRKDERFKKQLTPFYSQYCAGNGFMQNKRRCTKSRKCKWNGGLKGYNQHVGYSQNYCGYKKC